MIRPATQADSAAFHDLAIRYIAESGQHREYSWAWTQRALESFLADGNTLLLVADAETGFAGGILAMLDHAFTAQPVCLVSMFYVRPEYRGTGLARALVQGCVAWADAAHCSHTFASANAMLSDAETQMFVNLCRKFGFQPAGSPVLARRKPS
jgi:GNAT superfamily N-acetyltransferase